MNLHYTHIKYDYFFLKYSFVKTITDVLIIHLKGTSHSEDLKSHVMMNVKKIC